MLFGLILLSLNLEHILERLVVFIFFWWESPALPTLVLKNLVAHRVRNRKTTIMFALSIAFILFLAVTYRVEILSARYDDLKYHGAELAIEAEWWNHITSNQLLDLEAILTSPDAAEIVLDFATVSVNLGSGYGFYQCAISNVGHNRIMQTDTVGVSANYFEVATNLFTAEAQTVPAFAGELYVCIR
jgi:hypothetical protein